MAFYEFKYLHATAEHCLKRPMPANVEVAYRDVDKIVYAVDLPASVWATVSMSTLDPFENEIHRFPSAGLRREWIDQWISERQSSLQQATP